MPLPEQTTPLELRRALIKELVALLALPTTRFDLVSLHVEEQELTVVVTERSPGFVGLVGGRFALPASVDELSAPPGPRDLDWDISNWASDLVYVAGFSEGIDTGDLAPADADGVHWLR